MARPCPTVGPLASSSPLVRRCRRGIANLPRRAYASTKEQWSGVLLHAQPSGRAQTKKFRSLLNRERARCVATRVPTSFDQIKRRIPVYERVGGSNPTSRSAGFNRRLNASAVSPFAIVGADAAEQANKGRAPGASDQRGSRSRTRAPA